MYQIFPKPYADEKRGDLANRLTHMMRVAERRIRHEDIFKFAIECPLGVRIYANNKEEGQTLVDLGRIGKLWLVPHMWPPGASAPRRLP